MLQKVMNAHTRNPLSDYNKMVQQFVLYMFLLIWPIYILASENLETPFDIPEHGPIIAQPGCHCKCENVYIPYPFGMKDPKCYAHKWFEIECRNANSTNTTTHFQKPYLKCLNLEVTSIDEKLGTVQINNPIVNQVTPSAHIKDLRGSPFMYSQLYNKFVVVGCNIIAFLNSNGSKVGVCASICDREPRNFNDFIADFRDNVIDDCHGRYCCETWMPKHLSEYNATLANLTMNSVVSSWSYAVIVKKDWKVIASNNYAPAVLKWEIPNSVHLELKDAECHDTYVTSSQNRHSGRRCFCRKGFYGNPYIVGGCVLRRLQWFPYERIATKNLVIGVSSSLGSITLLLGLWWLYKIVKRRMIQKRKEKFFKQNGGLLLQNRLSSGQVNVDKARLFCLKDLEKATNHFSMNRVLGMGGQGTVYKGMLIDGNIVAVKKFKVQGKVEEFINEFFILSQINHRNVVKLLGCCLESEIPLLVYEFIPHGTLFEYLHDQNEEVPMTWEMRLRIGTEVAGALFYLHSAASQPIYHRDIKSTNILLDEKYRAKVADFGISRMISIEDTHLTTLVRGTFGYFDPEYFRTSHFMEKSDVYSFGVVLVELLTGKKPISFITSEETTSLALSFIICMEENRLFDIIDERIKKEGKKEYIIAVADLANRCLHSKGKKRPSMKEVAKVLEWIWKLEKKSNAQQKHEDIGHAGIEDTNFGEHVISSD